MRFLAPGIMALPADDDLGEPSIEAMLQMKRKLEERLAKVGVIPGDSPEASETDVNGVAKCVPAPLPRAFASFAAQRGCRLKDDGQNRTATTNQGQVYRVVYKPKVAIRKFPSLESDFIRSVFYGQKVRLFEWDHTRTWRRCTVLRCRANEEDSDDENVVSGNGLVRCNGWMLVHHPNYGPLLEGVPLDGAFDEADRMIMAPPAKLERAVDVVKSAGLPQNSDSLTMQQRRQRVKAIEATVDGNMGESTLMRVVRAGSYDAAKDILTGVGGLFQDVDAEDLRGETALFEAVALRRVDLVALLLMCGARPRKASKDNLTPLAMATDEVIRNLLSHFAGQHIFESDRRRCLALAHPSDRPRLAEKLQLVFDPASRRRESKRSSSKDSSSGSLYRVVHKSVAVRTLPSVDAKAIRVKKSGEEVMMYEWDSTRNWRRVRVKAIQEGSREGTALEEVDGWMLLQSISIGKLLEEIPRDISDDEMAG